VAIDDIFPLGDPAHDAMRGELARLFIAHKTDLAIAHFADADIVARVDDVEAVVLARFLSCRERFVGRFPWLADAIERLQRGELAVPMDG